MNPVNCVFRVPARDSYVTSGPQLMGRQSANEGLLKAWFAHTDHADYWCLARQRQEAEVFARIGQGIRRPERAVRSTYRWIQQSEIDRVRAVGTVFAPGPQVAELGWIRRRHAQAGDDAFSIVGLTHTSCEMSVQDALANMISAPVFDWDAQICPSFSVQAMVQRLLDDEAAWLREHLQAARIPRIHLPVLSLGIDCERFDPPEPIRQAHRQTWRGQWGLSDDTVVALYVGRLDLRSKSSLYPMFDALELASQSLAARGGPALACVLAGWYFSDWDQQAIESARQQVCPSVRLIVEDGRPESTRQSIWFAADFFTSLVDNIQETFGLTPIEALASRLPAVVTDFDGYKESVRDGVDGFRIRTVQPPAGCGVALIDAHADLMLGYRDYVGQVSAMIGVDVAAAARAYTQLALEPALRQRMGQAGRTRAREQYDWKKLIPAYQALWQELSVLREDRRQRRTAAGLSAAGTLHPRRRDPLHSFAHYPSDTLSATTLIRPGPLCPGHAAAREEALRQLVGRPLYSHLAQGPVRQTIDRVMHTMLARGHWTPLAALADEQGPDRALYAAIGFLVKAGWLQWFTPGAPDMAAGSGAQP